MFEDVFARIHAAPQAVINEGFTEDNLEGTITTNKAKQTILTTLPYDEGWHIYVDGKEVECRETLGALIAFDIKGAGEHTLRMTYRSSAFTIGLAVTIAGILLFAAVCIVEFILKRKKHNLKLSASSEDVLWEIDDFSVEIEEPEKQSEADTLAENTEDTEITQNTEISEDTKDTENNENN